MHRRAELRAGLVLRPLPFDVERVAAFHRRPRRRGDDADAAPRRLGAVRLDGHDVLHAGDRLRLRRVEARHLRAERRRAEDAGVEHPRQADVDAVVGLADDEVGVVDAVRFLADDGELRRILERDVFRHVDLRGGLGELAERRFLRAVRDDAVADRDLLRVDAPLRRGGADEHRPRGRAGLAHRRPHRPHAAAAARPHAAVLLVEVGLTDADVLPLRIHLLGHDHRQRRAHALAHVGLRHVDGDEAVGADLDERAEGMRGIGDRCRSRELQAEDEAGGGGGGELDEVAAGDLNDVHFHTSSAAR